MSEGKKFSFICNKKGVSTVYIGEVIPMANILLIEPAQEDQLRAVELLTQVGHEVTSCSTLEQAQRLLSGGLHRMTVLNASLPWSGSSGFLHALEARGLPVLFITAEQAQAEELKSVYRPECDVLLAPYDDRSLLRAVSCLLNSSARYLSAGPVEMDVLAERVTLDGQELTLTHQEFELLRALMCCPGIAQSRQELLHSAWGYLGIGVTRTVDVHVQRLRQKLGPNRIRTAHRIGYQLNVG